MSPKLSRVKLMLSQIIYEMVRDRLWLCLAELLILLCKSIFVVSSEEEKLLYTVRDPVHGFLQFNQLEWDIINSPEFQRLRRIRQLAWTDLVYPSAMHTRFTHSLGVCHVATRLFDAITSRDEDILRAEYKYDAGGQQRQRQIIRLAALMHDLGHAPFSHAAEHLFPPRDGSNKRYEHEDYSASIARKVFEDIINSSEFNRRNMNITENEVLSFFDPSANSSDTLVWKDIISGQMDADRMDYLLRDSYHSGVTYGNYDLDRVIDTVCLCEDTEVGGHHVGVSEPGYHAVEGLLIARYMMFTQVYFHKTRVIYDYHFGEALKYMLTENGLCFPGPGADQISEYMRWDDWRVLADLHSGNGGEHGKRIVERNHYRLCHSTAEISSVAEVQKFEEITASLPNHIPRQVREANKSWYKLGGDEIRVKLEDGSSMPLAAMSPVVDGLKSVNQKRLYVPAEFRAEATNLIAAWGGK